MKEKEFREFYEKRRSTPEATKQAIQAVKKWEKQLNGEGKTIGAATIDDLKLYISKIVDTGESTEEKLLAIARYLHVIMRNDLYSYMATILGGRGVYNSISDRLADIAGEKKRKQVFHGFEQPPLGSEPEVYPSCTRELLERLNSTLPPEQVNLVLAGNHHRIPLEAFSEMKRRYEATATLANSSMVSIKD